MSRTTNSAPVPSQINSQLYQQQPQGANRPLSSTGNHMQQNVGGKGPIIMRNLDKPSGIGSQVRIMNNSVCLLRLNKFKKNSNIFFVSLNKYLYKK